MREGKDPLMNVQHINVSMRDGKDLPVEVQHVHVAMIGSMDLPVEVHHLHVSIRGNKDFSVDIHHLIASRGGNDPFIKGHIYLKNTQKCITDPRDVHVCESIYEPVDSNRTNLQITRTHSFTGIHNSTHNNFV